MVLKFGSEPTDVFYIEATGNAGVSIRRFSGIKAHMGTFYRKIVLRHLEWERPDSSLDTLEQFLNEVQGRKYDLNIGKLMKKQTMAAKHF